MSFADTLADLSGAKNVAAARRLLTAKFEQASLDSPSLDARLLIQHALGLEHAALASAPDRALTAGERNAIAQLAERRLSGEPVARIFGVKEFWGLALSLSSQRLWCRVRKPRRSSKRHSPPSNTGAAIRCALPISAPAPARFCSHCCTNCRMPRASAPTSQPAPSRPRKPMRRRTDFRRARNSCKPISAADFEPPFDLVVSNPPYIATDEIAALAPEVRDHDPQLALDGGRDGLDAYRIIAAQMPALLHERTARR